MHRFGPLACFASLLLVTATTAVIQGRLTNRWGVRPNAQLAMERLESPLPKELGSWHLDKEYELQPQVARILQNPACINCVYVHAQTGDVVRMFVLAGHPGPVSVHTPEICYDSRDFSIAGPRSIVEVKSSSGARHTFWELPLKPKRDLHGEPMRVFYAWSSGTTWEAAQHPRFGYGGLPHLYKLQIAVTTNPGSSAKDFDPALDFLTTFLAQLQPRLVEASRPNGSSS